LKGAINKNLEVGQNLEFFQKLWSTRLRTSLFLFFQDAVEDKFKEGLLKR